MALFKCKMCGGDLEIVEGASIAECEYCGTKQTVPKAIDENLQNLFNRANTLRIKSEFDKAEKLYEKLIQADSTQAEAYWGLILCKYGIEYVDDPATFKKVPTCHRASFESIVADEDYKSALKNADMSQRAIYEEQAKEIDRIQKDILALAQKEESYDVFICYKETDPAGHRTQDSVIANDIYYQLTQEGFKVFYAAITLEGKLGSAYEPIIFAALNSAKVMLAIGTKPEYFNAVWVKNEWSRYLKIIKKDRSKLLIPCYRDMDAYELPEEFAHLQAQDMSKIGFINDIVRGIKKVLNKDEPKPTVVKETVVNTFANLNTAPLLKRSFMFLEDGDFEKADEFFENVLNQDPENAQAYLGKLMAELRVSKQEQLKDCAAPFDNSSNYQKILRFADNTLKNDLVGYIEYINTRNENARLEDTYNQAAKAMRTAKTEEAYKKAAYQFRSISGYKDSDELAEKCLEAAKIARKDEILGKAQFALYENTINGCERAIALLESIPGWKNADELKEASIAKQAELTKAYYKKVKKDAKRKTIIGIIAAFAVCVIIVFSILLPSVIIPSVKYNNASQLMLSGKYKEALNIFAELDDYKDSIDKKMECHQWLGNHKIVINYYGYEEYVIPDGITSIDDGAFFQCRALTSITIPDSVTSIGENAFRDCSRLTNITIPNSVQSIGSHAFSGCISLESITLPFVGSYAASENDPYQYPFGYIFGTSNYTGGVETTQYYYGSSASHLNNTTYYIPVSLESVTITGGNILPDAFYSCNYLKSITLPDGITSIGDTAFYGCSALTNIKIPDSVTSIGDNAFNSCRQLTNITISNSVTRIGSSAFRNCVNLKSITIPNNVTHIGDYAFYGCDNLTELIFKDTDKWFYTGVVSDWEKTQGGNIVYVGNPLANVTHFTYSFSNCYWYKV